MVISLPELLYFPATGIETKKKKFVLQEVSKGIS